MYSDLREYNMTAYSDCCKGEGYRSYSVYILKVKTVGLAERLDEDGRMKVFKDDAKRFGKNSLKTSVPLIKIRNTWRERNLKGRNEEFSLI